MSEKNKFTNKKPSLSYIVIEPTIDQLYQKFHHAYQKKQYSQASQNLLQIISLCYNSKQNQFYLCRNLNMPFSQGPVSINNIPQDMNFSQLIVLMQHIKKTKQYYFCWVIYFNNDLNLWSVKFMKFYEIQQYQQYFDVKKNLIGIFVGKAINSIDLNRETAKQKQACKTYDDFNQRKQKSFAIKPKQKKSNNYTFDQTYFQKKKKKEEGTESKIYLKKPLPLKQKSFSMKASEFVFKNPQNQPQINNHSSFKKKNFKI